ncbi:hypothetical protein MNBD_DELTA01-710 [hydrothermal vent metagenome]|uniref:Uncharacterized protein n=1 Tax=hydrothermal vent metagenome TaxID=652676 RepID=A0A3B0QRM5_9ZZZZ
MGKAISKKIFTVVFSGIIFYLLCCGYADAGETGIKIKGSNERLVARDIDRGGDGFYTLKWCGNTGLIFRSENSKVGIIDIKTGERTSLNLRVGDSLLNCTLDGERFLYIDGESRGFAGKNKERYIADFAPRVGSWFDTAYDMYIYEIKTGKKVLVAGVQEDISYDALSPDGTKIFLEASHRLTANKDAIEWEVIPHAGSYNLTDTIWFPDSSGIVSYGRRYANILCIEFFGKDGWDRCFEQKDSMLELKVDRGGGIYYLEGHPLADKYFFNQCVIKDRKVSCKRMLDEYELVRSFDFMPGGDILFEDYDNDICVHRSTPEGRVTECVIGVRYGDHVYDGVSVVGVSPDGRWLAFDRYNKVKKPERKKIYWEFDLFLMELKDN